MLVKDLVNLIDDLKDYTVATQGQCQIIIGKSSRMYKDVANSKLQDLPGLTESDKVVNRIFCYIRKHGGSSE